MNLSTLLVRTPLMAAFAVITGCNSGSSSGGLKQATALYNQQQFTESHKVAVDAQEKAVGDQRFDAAYLAGLSAYQLGQTSEAGQRFEFASSATNPDTAARSKAMLGQVRLDQGRPREAATLLSEASPKLGPDDSKRCAYNCGVAYRNAGDEASAKRWFALSRGESDSASTPAPTSANAAVAKPAANVPTPALASGFSLQAGAFADKKRAQQAADEAVAAGRPSGITDVRIIPRRDEHGKTMYVVQLGNFPTREAATAARTKIGRLQYIVAAVASSGS